MELHYRTKVATLIAAVIVQQALIVSVSMQFEAGGQPPKGTDSPFPPVEFPVSVPSDAAANTWFAL